VTRELEQQRQQWQSSGAGSYRYELLVRCFCGPPLTEPVVIEVHNGVAVSVTHATTGASIDPASFSQFNTIDKLFGIIAESVDQGADDISVMYHPTLGYPIGINIDEIKRAVDDEVSYTVRTLELIP
jgi:hypothetical protein